MKNLPVFKQFAGNVIDPQWWRGGAVYQIYPRSYQDSNGDGIGDLAGITMRLPYIAALGVEAIWLSPFFKSPMKDFGYDVSDYCDVDPIFGTIDDFRILLERAHELGLRVIIDQVLSHTASSHPWFEQSRADRSNDKADWYVWADAKSDGTPPNNWLSVFGGSAWQWDTARQQYYMHNFLASQPDLNVHNLQVQQALLEVMRFWLDLGVDGFRFDTVNFYMHDLLLRDNPAKGVQAADKSIASANPYARQQHVFDKTRPENLAFLKRIRCLLDEYPGITTVGEVGADDSLAVMAEYTNDGDKLHSAYSFELLGTDCSASYVHDTVGRFEALVSDGWASWSISNHDVTRVATRWQGNSTPAALTLYASLQMSLRGTPYIYQGDELGLPEAQLRFDQLQDPVGITMWPIIKGRDGCRTPMPWDPTKPHAGFSDAESTWLPLPSSHVALAAANQQLQPDSVLAHYKAFLRWRKQVPALVFGDIDLLPTQGQVLAFIRGYEGTRLLCVFNVGADAADFRMPVDLVVRQQCDAPGTSRNQPSAGCLSLQAWSAYYAWLA